MQTPPGQLLTLPVSTNEPFLYLSNVTESPGAKPWTVIDACQPALPKSQAEALTPIRPCVLHAVAVGVAVNPTGVEVRVGEGKIGVLVGGACVNVAAGVLVAPGVA